ncbi:MAG: hypothetical protein ACSHX4_08650 [Opitutaceae bacterium]
MHTLNAYYAKIPENRASRLRQLKDRTEMDETLIAEAIRRALHL